MKIDFERVKRAAVAAGIKLGERVLAVGISEQRMVFFRDGEWVREFVVSTAAKGISSVEGSEGTPLGWHVICEKIGASLGSGMVLKGRVPTGAHFTEDAEHSAGGANLITSRILRLRGMEEGKNLGRRADGVCVDTFERYVYLHGTNREEGLGKAMSKGCVLLGNGEIIGLFDDVAVGDLVVVME